MAEILYLFFAPVLAVLAAIFLARAAAQRGGLAVALCWWLLAALVVPIASFLIAAFILDAANVRGGDGAIVFGLILLLVLVNALLYWLAYAIFDSKQSEKPPSIARRKEDWSADILKKLPHGAASTQLWGGFEYQGETIRVVEAGYVVGATVFPTIQGAVARIEEKE